MAEESLKNLQTYTLQLEQVEAALLSDPDNEELKRLQTDLQEVITLTKNLPELDVKSRNINSDEDDVGSLRQWKVGDRCSCLFTDDGKWYNALIDAITDDGLIALTFEKYGNSSVASISSIREPIEIDESINSFEAGQSSNEKDKLRRKLNEKQRLISKKKKQKKFDRQKMIEEAHEVDKAKWQAFTGKQGKSKKIKGLNKKSIFATPESSSGRVGIGTCGIGGKPMTEFTHAEKWRKGI